jgi:hypothetical protein
MTDDFTSSEAPSTVDTTIDGIQATTQRFSEAVVGEVFRLGIAQLVQLFLGRVIKRGGDSGLHFTGHRPLQLCAGLGVIGDHFPCKSLLLRIPFCCAILAASISSMSLIAASLMKSSVFGAIPSVELMPVFSPTDCA